MPYNDPFSLLAHEVRNKIIAAQRLHIIASKALKEEFTILNDLDKNLQVLMDEARKKCDENKR